MFPSRAQNLSMGLQDVASIVNAVVEIEKAPHQAIADNRAATNVTSRDAPPKLPAQAKHIGRYQDEMIKRAAPEVLLSYQACQMALNYEALLNSPMAKLGPSKAPAGK
jgi:hypothetical protein